ncbi:MAG: hypothetical protein ACI8QS_001042 [Planctomycetota bacterium]
MQNDNQPRVSPDAASIQEENLPESKADHLLLAGIMLEQGLADKRAAKRWRSAVMDGKWDASACAQEVLVSSSSARDDPRLRERSARLLRDFLMAPMQSGVRGAARKGRAKVRSGFAFVLVQMFILALFLVMAFSGAVLLRMKGKSLDSWADWVLDLF